MDCPNEEKIGENTYINPDALLSQRAKVYGGWIKKIEGEREEVAVKLFFPPHKEDIETMKAQASKIKDKPHSNVVKILEIDVSAHGFLSMCLAMEMCSKLNLHEQVMEMKKKRRKFSFNDCMSVAKQLGSALYHLRRNEILHRDIKPSNVLFSRDQRILKLTDFSLLNPPRPRTVTSESFKRIGTDGWRAPEVCERNEYGYGSDMYSLGLLLYFVWSNGEHAFGNALDLQNYNIKKNINRDLDKICFGPSEEARNLLQRTLEFEEQKRITAEDFHASPVWNGIKEEIENLEGEEFTPDSASIGESRVEGLSIAVCDRNSGSLHAFQPSSKTWRHMQGMHQDMVGVNMVLVCAEDCIYALLSNRKVFSIKYQDGHAEWEIARDMELEHGDTPPAAFLGRYIYVIGECQVKPGKPQKGERLDLSTRKWSVITDMTTSRSMHSVVACKGCVYSIGGKNCDETQEDQPNVVDNRGEKFDPSTDEWSPIAPMNNRRYGASAAASDDTIYVLGGARSNEGSLKDAEFYNTESEEWTVIGNMNHPRCFLGAAVVDNKIYAVNGYNMYATFFIAFLLAVCPRIHDIKTRLGVSHVTRPGTEGLQSMSAPPRLQEERVHLVHRSILQLFLFTPDLLNSDPH